MRVPLLGLTLLSLVACQSAETAAKLALTEHLEAQRAGAWDKMWATAKSDDREAMPVAEVGGMGAALAVLNLKPDAFTYTITSVTVADDVATIVGKSRMAAAPEEDRTWTMVHEAEGWRVDTSWAEDKAKRERDEKVSALFKTASEKATADDLTGAKSTLEEALALGPDDPTQMQAFLTQLDEAIKSTVAGRWRMRVETDSMTDDRNVYLSLRASSTVNKSVGDPERPTLMARCAERELDLLIAVGAGVDSDWGEPYRATGRYRFGSATAQPVYFTVADSNDAVFFRGAADWVRRLQEHSADHLLIEVPTFSAGRQTIDFELAGADKALPAVLEVCRK